MKEQKNWTEIITPERKFFSLKLNEVLDYWDLILLFVRRDFVSFYKQTILGPAWYVLQPLIQTCIYALMFGSAFKIAKETSVPSFLFYLSGTVSWWYFAQSVTKTSNTFTANAHIFGKVYFPRLTVPFSILISNLIGFSIQFFLFICIYTGYIFFGGFESQIGLNEILWIPVLIINMAMLGLGIGLIISSLTTKYKDFQQFIGFGVQLLMFASPVILPISIAEKMSNENPEGWGGLLKTVLEYNPMSPIIEGFRSVFFTDYQFDINRIGYSLSIGFILFIFGALLFRKTEQNFMDTV
ncbi:MAG: ABC transporter permease [Flavobacteriales bacterium]|nr:ABC transporter permease [Flavobacteriales bacterium]MBO72987.1 ABC transporter permease [Flavobacteriales bacterium]|tara:strand:- start:2492 stop:3382 length:891 start_codon:yes stop_codon:yes gene_type:complete